MLAATGTQVSAAGSPVAADEIADWVPVIDLSAERADVVAAIGDAGRRVGFLSIVNHGIPDEVLAALWDESVAFFDLPEEAKAAVAMPHPGYPYGYGRMAYETLSLSLGSEAPPDLKESFVMGPLDPSSPPFDDPDEASVWSANLWPVELPSLRPAWEAAYRSFSGLASRLLSLMALALDMPEDHFEPLIDRHTSAMRASNYPDLDRPAQAGQLRAGAHTDYGTLTILYPDPLIGGLEVERPDGAWAAVRPAPGALVVNLGDGMARWTNGRWRSTMHRVVPVPGRRQSIAFFHNANWEALIECLPTCLAPGEQPLHPPIAAGPHLMSKFRSTVVPGY